MLFHITGPSGSGKSTLGKKLKNLSNTIVIDTDEIDDFNAQEILSNEKYQNFFSSEKTIGGFWKMLEQKNLDKLLELFEKNKGKNIILVGMTIYPPQETNVYGYSIDIGSNDNYFQINTRTLEEICSNCIDLKDLFSKEKNKFKIDLEILFRYKIRQGFPLIPFQVDEGIQLRKKHDEELGYKYLHQEDIIKDIEKIITESGTNSKKISRNIKLTVKSKSNSNSNSKSKSNSNSNSNIDLD